MKYVNNLLSGLLFGHIALLSAGNSNAQHFTEEDLYGEFPVILSASRLEQPLIESPSSVTVINREMIVNSGAREIKDLFRLVPGFQVYNYKANIPIVTYHGMSEQYSRRLQVLINGRPAYEPSFGGVFWSDIPYDIEDIERIEVIRGPNAALYGSNSFSAVINITTLPEASNTESKFVTRQGQNNINDIYLSYSDNADSTHYTFSASHTQDNGFQNVIDEKRSKRFNTLINKELTPKQNLIFEAGLLEGTRGLGLEHSTIDIPREKDITANFIRVKWNHENEAGDNVYIQYFTQRHETEDQYSVNSILNLDIPTPPFTVPIPVNTDVNFNVKSQRQEIEIQYTPDAKEHFQYVIGASLRSDTVNAPFLLDTRGHRKLRQSRIFSNIEYRISSKWLFNSGLMLENNEIVDTTASPKATLIYKIEDTQAIRLTVSRATRTPVLFEEYGLLEYTLNDIPPPFGPEIVSFEGSSSGNLKEETITSTEIGYQSFFHDHTTKFNLKVFHEQIRNLISQTMQPSDLSVDGDIFDFENTDDLTLRGIETSLEFHPSKSTQLSSGYTFTDAQSDNRANEYSTSVPRHTFFAFISHRINRYANISLTYNYYSGMDGLDSSLTSDLEKLDLRFKYLFDPSILDAELSFIIQDFHDNNRDYLYANVTDTTHYIEFKLNF